MRILLVHQNFPGQFRHLAPALAADPSNEVVVFTMNAFAGGYAIRSVRYQAPRSSSSDIHPWAAEAETKVIRGEAAFRAAVREKSQGFYPDVIYAHPGWGESLFLKEVWPTARLIVYCEFFYRSEGADVGFDPEFPIQDPGERCRVFMKNAALLMHLETADDCVAPTLWQRNTFPTYFRSRIRVIHDGIDTDLASPNPKVNVTLNQRGALTRADEVITFVSRTLEPVRGYHIFMRALPEILRRRPQARIIIVGSESKPYGAGAPPGLTWKQKYLGEVKDRIDLERVYFVGNVPYNAFIALLQLSTVHVYLTYPFVLSWSALEAMSTGCAIVGSDTAPVREVISHDETGRLFNFFEPGQLAGEVVSLLESPDERRRLGCNAREMVRSRYDLRAVCLPRQLELIIG
jgi:glycosyltransferase involved in cell wall biosynthesis